MVLIVAALALVLLTVLSTSIRVMQQYEEGVLFRFGRVVGEREPGLQLIVALVDVLRRV